ncbi:MAG: flagellar motor switch protein FliN [Nitrospinota bacterium]
MAKDNRLDVNVLDDEDNQERSFEEIQEQRPQIPPELDFIRDIPMRVSVELARTRILVKDLIRIQSNQVMEMDKLVGEPLEIFINDQLVAKGEVVVINDRFGIRLTDIVSQLETGGQKS